MEHRVRTERCGGVGLARWLGIWVMMATLAGAVSAWAKLDTWRQEGAAASASITASMVISDRGTPAWAKPCCRPGRWPPSGCGTLPAAVMARSSRPPAVGEVFRQSTKEAPDGGDRRGRYPGVGLAATPDGKVYVGTGPGGQVIEVTDAQHPSLSSHPKVQYIWDLAADAKGDLFAATGPAGQLWKHYATASGRWIAKATHLLCVALASDGTVYAGSDGEGLIFRINREGKVSVLYDAPQSEVRTLLLAPDGSLYAGTAAESGGGGSSSAPIAVLLAQRR